MREYKSRLQFAIEQANTCIKDMWSTEKDVDGTYLSKSTRLFWAGFYILGYPVLVAECYPGPDDLVKNGTAYVKTDKRIEEEIYWSVPGENIDK
ncbi:MAG: hypothetical protein V1870_03395 [Candidatus Aenigmatarchaeota archaeon]